MLKIKEKIMKVSDVDFVLENGIELYKKDWNGDKYTEGFDGINKAELNHCYVPVYRFEIEGIDINVLEENSEEWLRAVEIVGFNEF